MKFFYLKGAIALALIACSSLIAQNNNKLKEIANEYTYNSNNQVNFIKLKEDYVINESAVEGFLNSVVLNNSDVKAIKIKSEPDHLGYLHTKYQLRYKNALVNNAIIIVHSRNGQVTSINGDLSVIQKPANTVNINEKSALQFALKKVNAKKYKWENKAEEAHTKQALNQPNFTYYPKGELVLYTHYSVAKQPSVFYAYKFNIYAEDPLYKANVIVDANSGAILEEENLICHADVPATAVTKYSGVQTMTVDNNATGSYRLRETGRGLGVETYNMQNTATYSATDFTNATTNWSVVNVDQAARDAHWGAEMTYDYYMTAHNRNSIDGAGYKLLSYVHYNTNYNNAFWDGLRMTYGDGNGTTFTILTALDVCGHEVTHGLTSNTSNLTYSNESGALNESFSDIFGTMIENYGRPTQWDWKIGQDMTPSGQGIRNMQNPNLFSDPDTYLGTYWYTGTADNGGVHTNSGVSNYWFYLLSQGGTGTNDINNAYNVTGITKASAAQIAFRALTVYFTPSTNYLAARGYCIQAAKDIFGNCSNEVVQTTNAWYAVGVGPAYSNVVASNFIANSTSFCSLPASVIFNNTTVNGNTYTWNFGDGSAASTTTNPAHTYTAAGTYTVKLKANGCLSAVDSITKPAYIVISIPNNPVTTGAARCGSGTLSLSASGTSQLYWYASPTATGTPLTIGSNYVTPSLSSNTTYYVVNTSTNAPVFGAATNTSIGTGGNYNTAGQYQIFDVIQASSLKTVVMYASTAGNRTIELRNSANVLITSTVANLAIGANTVNVNFALTPGTGFRLGIGGAAINLYRNSAGGAYPYNIGGLVSMTGSSAGGGFYYFFYNWQVQKDNCTSSAIAVTATVNTPPVLTVNSPTICSGQSISLNASAATNYTWSTGSNAQSINVTPAVTTVYNVTASNGPACNATASATVNVDPTPTVSATSATVCNGQSANLTASGATSYSWSSGQTTSNISVNPSSNTTYTVYGTTGNCSDNSVTNVIVNPLPVVAVTAAQTMVCTSDAPVTLVGTPSGGTYSGIGVTGNSFNPGTGAGSYYSVYAYTDNNGCSATDSVNVIVSICTDIKTVVNSTSFSLYPNPASDYFIVNSTNNAGLTLIVTDAAGRLIMKKELKSASEKINISQFAKGIYFIEVKEGSKAVYRTKIVKE
ncbi:MAG: M4 family metallopeptidase [Bacteroidia bacterium]|nr:M4 family metallopeptidase [Bacteroidia bacterium]